MTTTRLTGWFAYVRKLLAVAAGLAALALAQGLLDGGAAIAAQAVIAAATLAGVYRVPNAHCPTQHVPTRAQARQWLADQARRNAASFPKTPGGTVPPGGVTDGGNHAERKDTGQTP